VRVGLDLIEIARVRRALERYPSFRERVFTDAERAYCDARPNPAESYAGRFAAKEAVATSRSSDGRSRRCGSLAVWRHGRSASGRGRSTSR
jgi:holo-[acyl-carrier protein] synthase